MVHLAQNGTIGFDPQPYRALQLFSRKHLPVTSSKLGNCWESHGKVPALRKINVSSGMTTSFTCKAPTRPASWTSPASWFQKVHADPNVPIESTRPYATKKRRRVYELKRVWIRAQIVAMDPTSPNSRQTADNQNKNICLFTAACK